VASTTYQNGATVLRVDFAYDTDGNLLSESRYDSLSGGASNLVGATQYGYDGNQLTSLVQTDAGGNVIAQYSYSYDTDGRLSSETDNGTATAYAYDAAGQLIQAGSQTYSYDANGNPTDSGIRMGPDNELLSDGTWNYSYDADGNLIGKTNISNGTSWTYTYDDANDMTAAVEKDSSGNVLVSASYTYNVFGNCISETVMQGGTAATQQLAYTQQGTLYASLDGNGNVQNRYVPDVQGPNYWQAQVTPSGVQWLLSDRQGTVRVLTDMTGTVLDRISDDAFGSLVSQTDAALQPLPEFQGMLFDAASGLYLVALTQTGRVYDPQLGRWQQLDPAQQGSNWYEGLGNAPTDGRDPNGRLVSTLDNGNAQQVFNAVSTLLANFHTEATGSPGDSGTLWRHQRNWFSKNTWNMDPLSAEYTAPISRYIGELGWQPKDSDAGNVARVIWQSHSEQINLVGSLVNEDGQERLHFQAEQQQNISDFILQKTEFLKSIEDFHGNLSKLYESLTSFAQELGSSGGKLLSALRTQPLTV
jgi:RHS repeat-associated protein